MQLSTPENSNDEFTPEQRAYIVKYTAGLLVSWVGHAVSQLITPNVADGFEPPEGVFPPRPDQVGDDPDEDLTFKASGEVVEVMDKWFTQIAKLAGFETEEEAWKAVGETETVYGKYPVMKE